MAQTAKIYNYWLETTILAILARNDNVIIEETTGTTTKIFIFLDSPFSLKYTDPQVTCSILDWSSVKYSVMYKNKTNDKEQWKTQTPVYKVRMYEKAFFYNGCVIFNQIQIVKFL